MEQRSSSLEEIMLHRAMEQSHLHYGGQGPAKNPLELLIDRELDEDQAKNQRSDAEVLHHLLTFASDGINIPGVIIRWKRISRRIKEGESVHYQKERKADAIPWPYVEILNQSGEVTQRYEPARLKHIRKARTRDKGPTAVILAMSTE